jgi:hypothetical protein
MLYRFVHNRIDLVFGYVRDLLGATVQQCFELCNDSGFTFRWGNPLCLNGYNTDTFLARVKDPFTTLLHFNYRI